MVFYVLPVEPTASAFVCGRAHSRRDSQTQSGKCSTLYVTALGQCLAADAAKGKGH